MTAESVLITGTTTGVGRALLELYVKNGARVIAVNRRRVPELEACYPQVRFECVDVRSSEAVEQLLQALTQSADLPSVFILNAGINLTDNGEAFELGSFKSVVETNLLGVLNFVEPLMRLAPGSLPRRLIAISSMASYVGNPYCLGYSASKRALTHCFDVLSKMYAGTDLIFQRVMLGPVRTDMFAMHDSFPAWMVWLKRVCSASREGTARAVAGFAASRGRRLFYPRRAVPLYLGMWLCRSLVPGFFQGRKTPRGKARRLVAVTGTPTAGAGAPR